MTFATPAALWALALPLALLLLALVPARAPERAVGTLALWRRVAPAASVRGAHRRWRIPLWLGLLCSGLAALAVAAAEPGRPRAAAGRAVDVVFESGPALALDWIAADGAARGTRLERALAQLDDWLDGRGGERPRPRWHVGGAPRERLDRDALAADLAVAPAVDWSAWDRPGVLWVRSAAPPTRPAFASWIAPGGGAVPGPVAVDGDAELVWDGATLSRRPRTGPAPAITIDAPEPWSAVARVWAGARGLAVLEPGAGGPPAARPVLRVVTVGAADTAEPRPTGREGWSVTVAAGEPRTATGQPWLDAGGAPVAWTSPGRLAVAAGPWGPPTGDPVAFAASVGRLLDGLRLPAPGTAPVAARADRGAGGVHTGVAPPARPPIERPLAHLPATLGAALLALAALSAGRRP